MIEFVDVSKRYEGGAAWAVRELSLRVEGGELVALLGESGSGKTTLLKMVNRLLDPDRGTVRVAGRDVRGEDPVALRRTIGYVIQHAGLLPHLSVADNVAMVPRLLGWQRGEIEQRVDELLALVGLPPADYRARYPDQLSGGQRQRVGVARALAARPQVVLLDEPFGALDPITRVALQGELARIHRELGLTTLLVTHDMAEALSLADRVVVMCAGEVRQIATPRELLTAPADDYVARLVDVVRTQNRRLNALEESEPGEPGDRGEPGGRTEPGGGAEPSERSGSREPGGRTEPGGGAEPSERSGSREPSDRAEPGGSPVEPRERGDG